MVRKGKADKGVVPTHGDQSSPILEVFNPAGAVETSQTHAPRLDTLDAKTICLLSNDSWQAHRMLHLIPALLQERFPTAKVVAHTEFPMGIKEIDSDETAELIKQKGCQAVIIGNAG